ncbi:helix-turn-helix domain-containing protein [Streptomyces sp. MUM 16J]|uniref:helix-turn-helix domain-containing protein n=1 Tax=Streptomyces sp. MUM 16J TaxID=2791988 RepID=UPI001F040E64|nr:helix-turn-helix domain-containing protein [Streptomyces sp. MUM 16J]MCH0557519.1 helix-turn-helix domain-containing protein [Streptomyces sp. MUM 16J]
MDTQNPSASKHLQSRVAANKHPNRGRGSAGLVHDNTRHTRNFTVIGNHLAQHPELSGLAIGIGVYIQSLPAGARVDIKTLAGRFPEGAIRVARALRELEAHGYLRRERRRLTDGRIVTRTVSCNRPGHQEASYEPGPPPPGHRSPEDPKTLENPETLETPENPKKAKRPSKPNKPNKPEKPEKPEKVPRKPLPPVPRPACSSPELIRLATDLLADLRRHDPRLLLSETDTAHLAPGVAAWLERDMPPAAVRRALTTGLPAEPLCRPAALLAHRLATRLPPVPPFRAPEPPPPVRHPLQNCDGCDHAFRSPTPGLCPGCRSDLPEAA